MTALQVLAMEELSGVDLDLDANDERSMKRAFATYIKPWLKDLPTDRQEAFRITLAYFLKQDDFPEVTWMTHGLSLNDPVDERRVFVWLWEILYPGARPEHTDTKDVVEENDIMGINRIQGIDLPDDYFRCQ